MVSVWPLRTRHGRGRRHALQGVTAFHQPLFLHLLGKVFVALEKGIEFRGAGLGIGRLVAVDQQGVLHRLSPTVKGKCSHLSLELNSPFRRMAIAQIDSKKINRKKPITPMIAAPVRD